MARPQHSPRSLPRGSSLINDNQCGHMMAGFDLHSFCACCRDKKKGKDPCVEKPNVECQLCKALTPEQASQLATPSYKLKNQSINQSDVHVLNLRINGF